MSSSLMAISPLDGRYTSKLDHLRQTLSEFGLIRFRVLIEIRWLIALIQNDEISELNAFNKKDLPFLESIIDDFNLQDAERVKTIEQTTNHDVKAIEYFIREKILVRPEFNFLIPFIHFACTSEDINNLSYSLMLKEVRENALMPALLEILENLTHKADEYAKIAMLARTHGQTATPTTLGKEFANFAARLDYQCQTLKNQRLLGKFNGAVGNYNAHYAAYPEINWVEFNAKFVESLGLTFNPYTTQIEPHDFIAEFLQCLIRINIILLDLSRDFWTYTSLGYFQQKSSANEVGSSTMPHKINPIDFENAEGNLGIANALADHLAFKLPVSRLQRDLSDSTAMRNIGSIMGYAVLSYQALQKGLNKISANAKFIQTDLAERWEVLAEPIQTVMRRYGIADAYEQLKAFTRGKSITQQSMRQFIDQLKIPESAKKHLLGLTPENYIGEATELAKKCKQKSR